MLQKAHVAKEIRHIRASLGLTQKQFADVLDVSVSTISMYENGERIPRDEIKAKIARIAGKTVDCIFYCN